MIGKSHILASALSLVGLLLGAVGCGGGPPSQLSGCRRSCDKQGECANVGPSAVAQCKSACDAAKATFDGNDDAIETTCANADTVKQKVFDCYDVSCEVNAANNCVDDVVMNQCVRS